MFKYTHLSLVISMLNFGCMVGQEILTSIPMQISEFKSTVTGPVVDNDGIVHFLGTASDNIYEKDLIHIEFDSTSDEISYEKIRLPSGYNLNDIVGKVVTHNNVIELFSHNKGRDEFEVISVSSNKITSRKIDLKLKKEKVIQYINQNNEFEILTVERKSSILNLYRYDGTSFDSLHFDLTNERFYSEDLKLETLSYLFSESGIATISPDLPLSIIAYGQKVKIYPDGNQIIITLNNNKNGTRIIYLDKDKEVATTDYIGLPTQKFTNNTGVPIKANSYISGKDIYSLVFTKDLIIIDLSNITSKKSFVQFEIMANGRMSPLSSPDQITVESKNNKDSIEKTFMEKATEFFKGLRSSQLYGLYAEKIKETNILHVGGVVLPTSAGAGTFMPGAPTASINSSGNISFSNGPPMYVPNMGFSSVGDNFEKHLQLGVDQRKIIEDLNFKNINNQVDHFKFNYEKVQFESLTNFDNYFLYGFFDQIEKIFIVVRFEK